MRLRGRFDGAQAGHAGPQRVGFPVEVGDVDVDAIGRQVVVVDAAAIKGLAGPVGPLDSKVPVTDSHVVQLKVERLGGRGRVGRPAQALNGRQKLVERSRVGLPGYVAQHKARLGERERAHVQVPRVKYRKQPNIGVGLAYPQQLAAAPVQHPHALQQHVRKWPHVDAADCYGLA